MKQLIQHKLKTNIIGRTGHVMGYGQYVKKSSPLVNIDLHAGQSNSDEAVSGDTVAALSELGVPNPAYSEAPHPGKTLTNWYNSGGAQEFSIDTDPQIAVVTLVHDGAGNATLTGGAGVFNQYDAKVRIIIEGSTTTEWNGVYTNTQGSPTNILKFQVPITHTTTATGTITVRRAGMWEAFASDIKTQTDLGKYVNVRHFHWMQGNGNAQAATVAQYAFFREFIKYIKEAVHTELGVLENVTIDRNFIITVGLTAQHLTAITDPDELHEVRRYQIDACRHLPYAVYVESIDFNRADGVHITDINAFKSRAIQASISRTNYTNLTGK